jgi:mannose/fructose-specific phosphotransferase system component IIA
VPVEVALAQLVLRPMQQRAIELLEKAEMEFHFRSLVRLSHMAVVVAVVHVIHAEALQKELLVLVDPVAAVPVETMHRILLQVPMHSAVVAAVAKPELVRKAVQVLSLFDT